jgi:hypothetical protein
MKNKTIKISVILITIFVLIYITIISSKEKKNFDCINSKLNSINNYKHFNYFDTVKVIEKELIKTNVLENYSKESYLRFINGIDSIKINENLRKKLVFENKSLFFKEMNNIFYASNTLRLCCECLPNKVDNQRKLLYDSFLFEKLNKKHLIKLLNITDFNCENERFILLNYIYLYLNTMYDKKVDIKINW